MKVTKDFNQYFIGVQPNKIKYFYAEQENDYLCWAASVQMVLKYYGMDISQKKLVELISKGKQCYPNCPENFSSVVEVLDNYIYNNSFLLKLNAIYGLPNVNSLISDLENEHPVIIGIIEDESTKIGHAVVLTNLEYVIGFNGLPYISKLYVLDPWSSQENRNNNGIKEYKGEYMSIILNQYLTIRFHEIIKNQEFG